MGRAIRSGRRIADPTAATAQGPRRLSWARSCASRRRSAQADAGFAILETALAIPILVAVTVLLLLAITTGMRALQLTDRAHDYARALARGTSSAEIAARAARDLPNASLTLNQGATWVSVTLAQQIDLPVPALSGLSMTLERTATAPQELQ